MVCPSCKQDKCTECVDVLRSVFTDTTICQCRRQGHAGEPRDRQIADPETGTVYTPDGKVEISGTFSTYSGEEKWERVEGNHPA
jgi:hypothetical protein